MSIRKKSVPKAVAILALTIGTTFTSVTPAFAQATSETPQLMVPTYTNAELVSVGCDPNIWNKLVNDYLAKRGVERQVQARIQAYDQARAAPAAKTNGSPSGTSCIEGAIDTINNSMAAVNALMSIFSGGGIDWGSLAGSVIDRMGAYACNQIDVYTRNIAYSATSSLRGATGTINMYTAPTAGVTTGIGSINVGNSIIRGNTEAAPTLNSTESSTWIEKLNPFK